MRTYSEFGAVVVNGMPHVVTPVCDEMRHLVCLPYDLSLLHAMAEAMKIKRCWFHKNHYDIPKTRIKEITARCKLVSTKEILNIIRGNEQK